MVQYYAKFLPNLSSRLEPLHQLLKKDAQWSWGQEQEQSFNDVKSMLLEDRVLTHFDPELEIIVACDSSSYGLEAVLSHRMLDGQERPIAYASRSLTKTERQYAQIEREALALYWGVKKFQLYLEGRQFTLITDRKPLQYIMAPDKAVPSTAAARLQRRCLFLGAFSYQIEYRSTTHHCNCDGISRLPLPGTEGHPDDEPDGVGIFYSNVIAALPVTEQDIRRATRNDPLLSRVIEFVHKGWERTDNEYLLPFYRKRDELTTHQGILLWGSRVVVPNKLQLGVMETLHEGHLGVVKMKGLARSYVWWENIDRDIEECARQCHGCQETGAEPIHAPLHKWEFPATHSYRFCGTCQGEDVHGHRRCTL